MQARARVRYLGVSPKKMRQVADLIKGKPLEEAMNILNFTPKVAAHHMAKTLKAAAANAIAGVGTAKLKVEDLSIRRVVVDAAPTAKRVRFQSMGRVFRIRKRFCHVTVEVEGEPEPETPKRRGQRRPKKETKDTGAAEPKAQKTVARRKTRAKARTKAEGEEEAIEEAKPRAEVDVDAGEETGAMSEKPGVPKETAAPDRSESEKKKNE
ncbi:MAG: 50S ribosomal protein L22 [Candidatus Zixiibacteriota bacterium]|nr:MAG: 50S ribosomal protein L22 [candidate division Zixibacteria bacterium]